jgi:hypothetical protein
MVVLNKGKYNYQIDHSKVNENLHISCIQPQLMHNYELQQRQIYDKLSPKFKETYNELIKNIPREEIDELLIIAKQQSIGNFTPNYIAMIHKVTQNLSPELINKLEELTVSLFAN